MRNASSSVDTKILPSPMDPVLAAAAIRATTLSILSSGTMTSTFILGRKSTVYSPPRYISVWPFWRPNPRTSVTVMPMTPASVSASFTSSSLNGLMIASIFFIADLSPAPLRRHDARADRVAGRPTDQAVHQSARAVDLRIPVGAHLGNVEALELDLRRHTHPQREVHEPEE